MDHINKEYSYAQYLELSERLSAEFGTTGLDQTEEHKKYTQLNQKRMERWNKTFAIPEHLNAKLTNIKPQTWILISETWCGDSAQILPILAKIAEASNNTIELKIILRDENPIWMEKYHTNGSRSIPKLIAFDHSGQELFVWGPRPKTAVEIFKNWKANPETIDKEEFHRQLHTWYAKDKGQEIVTEIMNLLN